MSRPTLFAGVKPSHRLAQEEIFGPVQVVIAFDDEAEAVSIANGTGYGLVAGVWTADGARQMRLAKTLRAGQVFLNNYGAGGGRRTAVRRGRQIRTRPREGVRGAVRVLGVEDGRGMARLTDMSRLRTMAPLCAALALSGCALAPEYKTFYLSNEDWSGTALSARGKLTVSDSVAGVAPNTITVLNIGALGTAPRDYLGRLRTQDERARTLMAALERRGVAPANIAVETLAADAPAPLWWPRKPTVVVVRY